jgi:anti-sigma factor RsiW
MSCEQTLKRLSAYLDEELDVSDLLAVADHLEGCAACQQAHAGLNTVRAQIKTKAPRHDAPTRLAAQIADALPKEPNVPRPAPIKQRWNWLGAGAVLVSLLAAVWSVNLYLALPAPQQQLAEAVLASHVRSLQANHLSDVASSDQHTVRPWFNGKLDFSPTVRDHTTEGFPLVGGRLDYLDRQAVAALVYRHRLHNINLFIWPSTAKDSDVRVMDQRGYHLVSWVAGGMNYWAVSDLAGSELDTFTRLIQARG